MATSNASIIILGPQGCGKTLNAAALAKAFGLKHWAEADGRRSISLQDHVILANHGDIIPHACRSLRVVPFAEAIKRVPHPHPATPRQVSA